MALTISPGVFLLTTLIGRINYHYNVRQSDTHVTFVGGDIRHAEGFTLTSNKCSYKIDLDVELGPEGGLILNYWEKGQRVHHKGYDFLDGDERRDMFEELRKVLEGELVF